MTRVFLSKADVTEVEERFVLDAVRSGWVAPLGPHVDAFEAEVAAMSGVEHALALASGTAALHLGLLHLGARPGTAVIVPTLTFSASVNPVVYAGAEPVFVDCRDDGNLDPDLLALALDTLERENVPVVAVLSVDLFGRCADYDEIVPLLEARGVPLLADAAEAVGARYKGHPAGSFGAAAALSFNGNKIMTTSGGGMLVSNDAELIQRARYLATQARQPVAYYEHTEVGYNYRLSNILAALGRAQLTRLDAMMARRRRTREMYADAFSDLPDVRFLGRPSKDGVDGRGDSEDNCWLTCVEISPSTGVSPDQLIRHLDAHDIEARHIWKPMHLQPVFTGKRAFVSGVSKRLFDNGLTLPSGSSLGDEEISRVIEVLHAALAQKA